MSLFKRLLPNSLKQEGKYLLFDLLKIKYSRSGAPLGVLKWLPKGKPITFFDIGANIGHFTLSICGEYEIEKAFLIEPVAKVIPLLEKNFPDKEKFKILNVAISDVIGDTEFFINDDFDPVSSLLKINNKSDELKSLNLKDPVSTRIKTRTLDDIVSEYQLTDIDLIKIDVQGAEHLVLKSATETLKRTKVVYTEFSFKQIYQNSSTFFDLYQLFYENGFALVDISPGYTSPSGELLQGDALFVNKRLLD